MSLKGEMVSGEWDTKRRWTDQVPEFGFALVSMLTFRYVPGPSPDNLICWSLQNWPWKTSQFLPEPTEGAFHMVSLFSV